MDRAPWKVVVGDVSREIHREADAHNEHDHADDVDVDVDDGHESDDAHLHRDDGEDDPDDAGLVGDEDQCDDGHADHAAAAKADCKKHAPKSDKHINWKSKEVFQILNNKQLGNLPDGAGHCGLYHLRVLVKKAKERMIDDNFEWSIGGNLAHQMEHLDLFDGVPHTRALHEKARGNHRRPVRTEEYVGFYLRSSRFPHELVEIFVEFFSGVHPVKVVARLHILHSQARKFILLLLLEPCFLDVIILYILISAFFCTLVQLSPILMCLLMDLNQDLIDNEQ